MDLQQVFTTVTSSLLNQGEPSIDNDGSCCYRGPGQLKCALGHLIPDANYTPEIEGYSLSHQSVVQRLPFPVPVDSRLYELLQQLQSVHDAEDVSQWPESFAGIATEYGLTI